MEEVHYQNKKQQNKQLIILFKKLQDLEESYWSKLFRFEKSQYFLQFQKAYTVSDIISFRLDDFIYLLLLIIQELIFGLLPLDSSNYFVTPFRQSLALFFLTSFILLISRHWFRWLCLFFFCIVYPCLLYVTFNGYISLMPVDTSTIIISYLGYLTLVPIFILLILIYPLKQYIRNNAGAIYSYVYALSATLILYLWPLYSFISSGDMSFSFIYSNQPLIITFIVVIITFFYFFVHNSLFQAKIDKIKALLLQDFSLGQLTKALQQIQEQDETEESCIISNFNKYVRFVSFMIYSLNVAGQVMLYLFIVNDSSKSMPIGPIMGYNIAFILFGAFLVGSSISKEILLPILAILSLSSALPSFSYYHSSTNIYDFMIISGSFPFFAIFWSLIKIISPKRPIFRVNSIISLYIVIFIPVMTLVLNEYQVFTSNSSLVSTLNYALLSLIGFILVVLIIIFIVWQFKKKVQTKQEENKTVPVDYNYFEQGNPTYHHYQISKQFSLGYLVHIDIRQIGYMLSMIFFLGSELMTIYAVNELNTTFASTTFYSSIIHQVIYCQFYINLIFYIYSHMYLANPEGRFIKYLFVTYFVITSVVFLTMGYLVDSGSTALKIVGGFSLLMILIVISLEVIKSAAQKIFSFVSAIIVISLWLFIIFPFVQLIPFVSIFVDQTKFGTFVYTCILGTVILLVFLVGVLTLVFNQLIDKYQQEKKFKFITEDVITLLEQEGVQSQDQQLHVLYQSFLYRDKKYVFFLKRGYPVNLLKDPSDQVTKLVTTQDYNLKRIPTKNDLQTSQKSSSCLWICLTCCCGQDQQQITQKIKNAKKIMNKEQLQRLLPRSLKTGLIKLPANDEVRTKKQWKNPQKIFSSKSLILKDMHSGPRYLGDEYILIKTNKNKDIAIEIWHNVFNFIANEDVGEPLIIYNDFRTFISAAEINLSSQQIDDLFLNFALRKWKNYNGMNLEDFALTVEDISQKLYNGSQQQADERKYVLLIEKVYYNLCSYEEFNNFATKEKTFKKMTRQQIKKSPFNSSFSRYQEHIVNNNKETEQIIVRRKKNDGNRLQQIFVHKQVQRQEQTSQVKGVSCKKQLFDLVKSCDNCCKKEQTKEQIELKMFVKPWQLLAVDVVKILQKKEHDWGSVSQMKQHPFRPISNNFLMAIFKLLDLYTYISISIRNPQTGWTSLFPSTTNLFLDYTIQTYLAAAVVLVSVPLGIRGIMLIFQDRLGLTQNRLPAAFPHPMFFFTFIYKLMILSLFGVISQTFLDTFNCNWTSSGSSYYLNDDPTIQCFSDSHSTMVLIALIGIIIYYPLSSYAMPNFQFAEKSLDLKYRSNYLILYFQVNFVLLAAKVLVLSNNTDFTVQIIYNSINIFALSILAISVFCLRPCFIGWFNYVQFIVIFIGVVVNVMGLVLYITQLWLTCVIIASCVCFGAIIFFIFFIRQRISSKQIVPYQQQEGNVQQLVMMWADKKKKDKKIIAYQSKSKPLNIPQKNDNLLNDQTDSGDDKTVENMKLKI